LCKNSYFFLFVSKRNATFVHFCEPHMFSTGHPKATLRLLKNMDH